MKDNLERYLELTSLKLYTTQFFEGQTLEEYKFKSFSFYLKKEEDIIKIISRHNKRIKLKIDFSFWLGKSYNKGAEGWGYEEWTVGSRGPIQQKI